MRPISPAVPARQLVAAGVAALTLAGLAASAGAAYTGQAPAQPAGFHTHYGASGEADVNVCSDATAPGQAHCLAHRRIDAGASRTPAPAGQTRATATLGNNGAYDPPFLQSAYNTPSANGAGQTVAIVDAYDDPNAAADLAYYRNFFGLPACTASTGCFRKLDEFGGTSYPPGDSGWASEISLDLDMVSAICPHCSIVLVEAASASLADLGTAVNTAVSLGANVVSNSYGGGEYSGEVSDGATYYNHPGVAVVASSGDSGYGVEFPAASNYVTAVGGTSLYQTTNTGTRNATETAWSGAGSGCSAYVAKPSWQHDAGCGHRTVADVSAVADPNTGVWVYDTYPSGGFQIYGGTSVASPIVGSIYALAGNPASSNQLSSYPYANTAALNDVTSGSNGNCGGSYLCTAGSGYDGPTGLGTPNGTPAFTGAPAVKTAPSAPQNLTATGGNATVALTWAAPASNGGEPVTSYNVYRGTAAGAEGTTPYAPGVTTTSYTDNGVTNGTTYYYTVTAVNSVGEGAASAERSATPQPPSPPSQPQNLTATPGNVTVSLSWTAPANNGGSPVTSYSIYRGTTPGGESATAIATVASTGYTDTGLHNGTTYYYTVKATNTNGTGPASAEASATPATVPAAPTGLTAKSASPKGVTLTWTAPSNGGAAISSYVVYRSTRSGRESSYVTVNCSSSGCSWTDTGTRSGTTYYYQVAATNSVGTGPRSNQASARAQ